MNTELNRFLRRSVPFTRSIARPSYQGRIPPHPNEEVVDQGLAQSVTNLAQVSLDRDNVCADDGGAAQLATVTGDLHSFLEVSLIVGVDTSTAPTGGSVPAGGQAGRAGDSGRAVTGGPSLPGDEGDPGRPPA